MSSGPRSCGAVLNSCNRHSTAHTVASFKASDFSLDNSDCEQVMRDYCCSRQYQYNQSHLLSLLLRSKLPPTVTRAADYVLDFSRQASASLSGEPRAPGFMHLLNFSSLITQSLVQFLSNQRKFEPMAEAFAVALLMFTVRTMNDPTKPVDSLHFAATNWLQCALDATDKANAEWNAELRLWVCTVGAICAEGSKQQEELERQFVRACADRGIESAEQLVEKMQDLLWVQERFDQWATTLWQRTRRKFEA